MYALDEIAADSMAFCQAVNQAGAYHPQYVKLKIMFGCNLKCEMCNHWRSTSEPPLSIPRLLEILSELADLGCKKIHISGGEPLLRPKVTNLVEHATDLGMRVTMTTNGTLLNKSQAKQLVLAGLRAVNISIDSPNRKIHDQVRGVDGAWKHAVRAVKYFRRYAHKGKLVIRINTVVSRRNFKSLADLPEFAHAIGADVINLIAVDDHCDEQLSLRRSDIVYFNAEIAPRIAERGLALGMINDLNQAYPFGYSLRELKRARKGEYAFGWYDRHPCFAPWTHSLIDYNGKVYVCCMTREQITPLGDLKTQSFNELWNDNLYHQIRQNMFPPALPACRRCDDFLEQNRKMLDILKTCQPS